MLTWIFLGTHPAFLSLVFSPIIFEFRDPPQRREARFAKTALPPYIPAAFCRDAGSAGHGATEAARPERLLQARVSRQGWRPARRRQLRWPVHDSPPRQGTPGKGISRRTTKQTIIRGSSNQSPEQEEKKENNQREGDVISDRS